MKSKLIILNGPLGIGKTTLARRYAEDHPLTLILDIDDVRAMLSYWREEKDVSASLSKRMAIGMAKVNLQAGYDVVIPQILQTTELADMFRHLSEECGSDYYEILLLVSKEEALRRFIERGKSQGYPTGFRFGGLIDEGGREAKLSEMYDNMLKVAATRRHIVKIKPALGLVEETYKKLIDSLCKS